LPDEFVEEGSDISPDYVEAIGSDVGADENDVPAEGVRRRVGDLEAEEPDDDAAGSEDEG